MSSSFGGLNLALSALYAQRRGLDVTGQNIANANTEGYSRQRLSMAAVGGLTVPALYSTWAGAGGGVDATEIARLRDGFLEARARAEHGQTSYLTMRQEVYGHVENVFAEPSDTALQSQLSDYWASWGDVANHPGDLATRAQLIQRGAVVADGLHTASQAMDSQWSTSRLQLNAYATEINTAAATVAQLNKAVQRAHAAGLPINELADQRDVNLIKLAELAGALAIERTDGTVDVMMGGSALVSGATARTVAAAGSMDLAGNTGTNMARLRWSDLDDTAIPISGGRVAGLLDSLNSILPGGVASLDAVAAKLAQTVNDQHALGFGLDGVGGRDFFTGTTSATIAVALTDPREVGVSASASADGRDGTNAHLMADIGRSTSGADELYRQMVAGVGVAAQTADRRAAIQVAVADSLDAERAAESGVNLDEEMTNMLAYQRAYEAASRVMTTVDQTLDVLINRTGLVGR